MSAYEESYGEAYEAQRQLYGEEEYPEGLDDPVGFQKQLYHQQLTAFGSGQGPSRRSATTPGTTSNARKHTPTRGSRGATVLPPASREAHDYQDYAGHADAYGELPRLRDSYEEEDLQRQQPAQQIVVLLPYTAEPPQDSRHVKRFSRLTPEKILFAIPPLILLVVLTVVVLRVVKKARRVGRTRVRFRGERGDSRRYTGRHRRHEHSTDDSYSTTEDYDSERRSSSPAPRRRSRRNSREKAYENEVEQLARMLRRQAAKRTAATERAAVARASGGSKSALAVAAKRTAATEGAALPRDAEGLKSALAVAREPKSAQSAEPGAGQATRPSSQLAPQTKKQEPALPQFADPNAGARDKTSDLSPLPTKIHGAKAAEPLKRAQPLRRKGRRRRPTRTVSSREGVAESAQKECAASRLEGAEPAPPLNASKVPAADYAASAPVSRTLHPR